MPPFDGAPAVHTRASAAPLVICSDVDFRATIAAKELGDYVGHTLASAYPGYRWRVEPHPHPQKPFVDIRCEHTNAAYGYTLQAWRYVSATAWKAAIIKAGGEILERNDLNRRSLDVAEFKNHKRDFTGLWTPDLAK
jgi:hypothetical protein